MPTSVFNKINAGFSLGTATPVTSGIEDVIYIFNEDEIKITYNTANPLIIDDLDKVGSGKVFKFEGTNNSFNAMSKLAKTQVGPRYTEEIDFNIAGLSVDVKAQLRAMGYGRVKAVVVNNYKGSDSAIELFGAVNSLILTEAERNAADEGLEGGYKLKLTNPDKLREPYPPRAVSIAPEGGGSATYDSTLAALEALTA
ncbi:hypothetical protein LLH06_06140 [Mucilaginibacter daejeonensis]|uniref:hypothetical protein n=1 Tax=Mucilaginibacter daejeonensis TaxID=398049 RepID=UPI001D174034|nr:hypothetical protein [Mucilaginibacter daejeonensis]UEG54539.1 hypothetical protein LLH06_06140 [Mucilaginibacter daejeonensis]